MQIFDMFGRTVATLVEGKRPVGRHEVSWNAEHLASGVYFYKLQTKDFTHTKKMILIR